MEYIARNLYPAWPGLCDGFLLLARVLYLCRLDIDRSGIPHLYRAVFYDQLSAELLLPYTWIKPENLNTYLVHTALYPCLINAILLFLVKIPDHKPQHEYTGLHDLILSLSMLLIVLAMLFRKKPYELATIISVRERDRKIHMSYLVTTVIFLLLFRLCLNDFFFSLF